MTNELSDRVTRLEEKMATMQSAVETTSKDINELTKIVHRVSNMFIGGVIVLLASEIGIIEAIGKLIF